MTDYLKPAFALGERCKHGSLARQCNACDDEREIAGLRADLAAAHYAKRIAEESEIRCAAELDEARADLAAVRALLREIRHACPQYNTGEWRDRFARIDAALKGE